MCGIVGAIAERNVSGILLEGLKRLEYRGYDSAGIALLNDSSGKIRDLKTVGKVKKLVNSPAKAKLRGGARNSPYPLGHAREAHCGQRPSA